MKARGRIRAPLFLVMSALVCGCGAINASPPLPSIQSGGVEPPEPIVSTAREGLEVHWWITDDTDGAVGLALAGFVEPALPSDPVVRERWNANGLRMVRIPFDGFGELHRALPAMRARRRLWVGWVTTWTEILRGRRAGGASVLIVDGQRTSLPPGVLRFIARCWPAPIATDLIVTPGNAVAVRFELACQLDIEHAPSAADVFREPKILEVLDAGPILRQLTLETTLDAGFVYVVTSEAPGVLWSSDRKVGTPGPPARDTPEAAEGGSGEPVRDDGGAILWTEEQPEFQLESLGPPASAPLTVGQAMLSASLAETGSRDVRIVIVLVPRTPERFRLLP